MKTRIVRRALLAALLGLGFVVSACGSGAGGAARLTERQIKAQAMFAERCKTAGEKIYRTVKNVEGVYLLKIRSRTNHGDQFRLDDPYGHDSTGDMYILNFLRGFYHQSQARPVAGDPPQMGYRYVEAADVHDGRRYRYTGRTEEPWQSNKAFLEGYTRFVLDKVVSPGPAPRYAVTYEDISTHEERQYWIAGSSLRVIDLQTNEVMGERVGYMMDWAQGSRAGGRAPWLFAADTACPGFQRNPQRPINRGGSAQPGQTLYFVEKVLEPSIN
ncbi:hypothetical protein [Variovorax sp. KK3]|uniref:hypothetical protein n=1 Tax=Variovorax sp. KK3 TaxID=1855728 RepID=UPI00097C002B|nr:hypothetical protein [Variovorax sp. KK3]